MNVEAKNRENTNHGCPPPITDSEQIKAMVQDAVNLNESVKQGLILAQHLQDKFRQEMKPYNYPKKAMDILIRNFKDARGLVVTEEDIIEANEKVLQCFGLWETTKWVQDDHCTEVFVRFQKFAELYGAEAKKVDKTDFIDSDAIGYCLDFLRKLLPAMQKTFDVKYFFKQARPLQRLYNWTGIDFRAVSNKPNPGHWSYIGGHITKSDIANKVIKQQYKFATREHFLIDVATLLFGLCRDASLIHLWQDSRLAPHNK